MIEIHDGHTSLAARPTLKFSTNQRAVLLLIEQEDVQLGFQLTRDQWHQIGEMMDDPKDD
ncbi:hypothetical protein GS445_01930 [Rhodococcus hoagii]|uniref:hypothetical protein n=1 Tax=Rhodococcus hoagii TaxID=43767 RepID=UPI00197E36A9|nr:hypothetical protein [Prescottella equi]MBM4512197.1 hypothetical protein [Prescottella equi]MBM4515246.1 hypothetical protein [Prescottella equi]MBM4548516.1 hypothetical protein [Prescottella equi]MBM4710884.1 hypothetical protein [Prescottella equi]MBP0086112.1 hypothetical protein [Prescottella equi]